MKKEDQSAAQENELVSQTAMHALAVVEHCLVVPEHKRDDAYFLRASVLNAAAWLKGVRTEMDRLASAPQPPITKDAPAPAQDGWKLVPVEPTDDMLFALAHDSKNNYPRTKNPVVHAIHMLAPYEAMLAVSPSPPLQPTPTAQPVIGELFCHPIGHRFYACINSKRGRVDIEGFDTEAEALAFIESCRPAQPNDTPEDVRDAP